MRSPKPLLIIACLFSASALSSPARAQSAAPHRIVIAVGTLFDGKGHVVKNTRIVVTDGKINALDPKAGPVDYDLHTLTVMPGWIDAHDHVTWSFGADGKNAGSDRTTQEAA